jgi:cytoskeletal protein CcmA (bactofilin family)
MWRKQPDPRPSPGAEDARPPAPPTPPEVRPPEPVRAAVRGSEGTTLGKSVVIKGEITGRENVFVDGEMEGSIRLTDANVTVGPAGRVTAGIEAREIEVHGQVRGTLQAAERVRIGRSGKLYGDVVTRRIAVEEGAVIQGSVDTARPGATRPDFRTENAELRKPKPETASVKVEAAPAGT